MKLRTLALILIALGLLAAPLPVEAQKARKVYRIGFLLLGYRSPYYELFSERANARSILLASLRG